MRILQVGQTGRLRRVGCDEFHAEARGGRRGQARGGLDSRIY